jgi:hypothetical protein
MMASATTDDARAPVALVAQIFGHARPFPQFDHDRV